MADSFEAMLSNIGNEEGPENTSDGTYMCTLCCDHLLSTIGMIFAVCLSVYMAAVMLRRCYVRPGTGCSSRRTPTYGFVVCPTTVHPVRPALRGIAMNHNCVWLRNAWCAGILVVYTLLCCGDSHSRVSGNPTSTRADDSAVHRIRPLFNEIQPPWRRWIVYIRSTLPRHP